MKNKRKYIAPTLKIYAYQPEGGYANSLLINQLDSDHTNGFENWQGWTDPGTNDNGSFGGGSNDNNWTWD